MSDVCVRCGGAILSKSQGKVEEIIEKWWEMDLNSMKLFVFFFWGGGLVVGENMMHMHCSMSSFFCFWNG